MCHMLMSLVKTKLKPLCRKSLLSPSFKFIFQFKYFGAGLTFSLVSFCLSNIPLAICSVLFASCFAARSVDLVSNINISFFLTITLNYSRTAPISGHPLEAEKVFGTRAGRLRECVNTEFVTGGLLSRAVRLRECPLREFRL